MKTILQTLFILLLLSPFAEADHFAFSYNATTGDVEVDTQIRDLNVRTKTDTDRALKELEVAYGISPRHSHLILDEYHISYGELYLVGELHKHSHRSIDYILKLRDRNLGWGEIAHKLGIHPSTLNKALKEVKKGGKGNKGKVKRKNKSKGKGKKHKS